MANEEPWKTRPRAQNGVAPVYFRDLVDRRWDTPIWLDASKEEQSKGKALEELAAASEPSTESTLNSISTSFVLYIVASSSSISPFSTFVIFVFIDTTLA
tara:strand:+ start:862 stop:1161 length:300 start_codon:yes stop_codon:yes gene_type:complete